MVPSSFIFNSNSMKNKNIQFIIFLVVFVVMLDFTLGNIYDSLYFSDKSRNNDRLVHSVLETNEDILIFGSSRAIHHYNPKIIQDSLNLTCYNVGVNGQNIYFHLALLKSAVERNKPKIAILDLFSIDFKETSSKNDKENLSVLLPFTNRSESSLSTVLLRGKSESIKLKSFIYPFNSLQYQILRNNFHPFNNSYQGFIPIHKEYKGDLEVKTIKNRPFDNIKMSALYEFIELCKEKNIELFIFVSPSYLTNTGTSNYMIITDKIKNKFDLNVNSFQNDSLFLKNPQYFSDPGHLNSIGADIYTTLAVETIKKNMFGK